MKDEVLEKRIDDFIIRSVRQTGYFSVYRLVRGIEKIQEERKYELMREFGKIEEEYFPLTKKKKHRSHKRGIKL